MNLRRKILLVKRASRLFLFCLLFLSAIVPFLIWPIWAQPPLPKEFAQAQSQPVQPPMPVPANGTLPVPFPAPNQQPGTPFMPAPATAPSASSMPSPIPGQQPGTPVTNTPGNNRPEPTNNQRLSVKRGEVSFNFDDADVYSVIQTIFGGVLKFNYIIDPKVKGRVNFRSVAPVAKEDVLPLMEVILRLNSIGVVEEGGLYRIIPIADMPREPATVKIGREPDKVSVTGLGLLQVVPLKYFTSTEMVRVLTPFVSANAVIVDVPKINYLILVDTDANVKRLLQLVEIFDSEQLKQIKPQVFVYPVQNAKAKDLSNLLQQIFLGAKSTTKPSTPATSTTPSTSMRNPPALTQQTPASPQTQLTIGPAGSGDALVSDITKIFPDEVSNSLVILATPEDYSLILETLRKLDQVQRQVMIEVLIAEISLTDDLKFGLEWSLKGRNSQGFGNVTGSFIPTPATPATGAAIPAPGFSFLGIDPTGLIRGFLQTLATQGRTNVLASPHILAADNKKAKIQIGSQVPVVTDVQSTTVTTQTVQYKDTGVILEITPTINDSGLVSLEINQEVSDYTFQAIGTNTFPVFTKRTASTFAVAQDGQTLVLGGLIQENKGRTRAGLPFLSKIPILGYLFGYTDDTFLRSEIVLLLTPHVVRNQEEAKNLTDFYIHRLNKSFNVHLNPEKPINQK
jgi:type II secretory pathway component GspD/PulD (secretin)